MTPDFNTVTLEPVDFAFCNRVINQITQDKLLPFMLPLESIPRMIRDSADFFYRESDDAVFERWLLIKNSDIKRDPTLNAVIQLPEVIQSVWQLYPVSGSSDVLLNHPVSFYRESLMYGNFGGSAINAIGGGATSVGPMSNMADKRDIYVQGLVSMYAYVQEKTMFTKGIRFDFNENTHELNLLGDTQGQSIVFAVFQRIPLAKLYNDRRFFKHVTANTLENLEMVLSLFDFQYPGRTKINFNKIQDFGKAQREKIEADILADSSGADLFIIR
jgi:hypothetical protein